MFDWVLAIGADVSILRIALFAFVFVLTFSLVTRVPAFSDRKIAVLLSFMVSAIAVLGFSDGVVVAVIAGYSGIGTAILLLLPAIVLIAVLFWRADSLAGSFIKLLSAILVLLFIELASSSFSSFGTTQVLGFEIERGIALITFAVYIIIFFFGFDVLSKLFFSRDSS